VTFRLPPASVLTPFDRVGDVVPWASVAIAAAASIWAWVVPPLRRRSRTDIP
jgi:apolipoprotein N-acyltransferase